MHIARSLKAGLAASVCLLPLQALAQTNDAYDVGKPAAGVWSEPGNFVDIGAQYRSNGSDYLGRFSGMQNPGWYGLGDFKVKGGDAWDSGGAFYYSAVGANLGQWDRSFNGAIGQQGTWGLSFDYQGIPYYGPGGDLGGSSGLLSIWSGNSGALVPGVAPGSVGVTFKQIAPAVTALGYPYPGVPTAGPPVSGPAIWQPVFKNSPAANMLWNNLSTQRNDYTLTGKYQWGDWTVIAQVYYEHKTGYKASSLNITGTPAATTSSAALPTTFTSALGYFAQPIDYDTERYNVTANWGNERTQVQLSYTYNNFTDNLSVFNALNPYAFTPTTTFGNPATMYAPWTLPPSNSAQQVKALFGYNFSPTARLNVNFGYDVMMQNAAFDMASGNPSAMRGAASAASLAPFEPRSSLDGLIQNFFGNVAFTAQPWQNVDVRLAYTLDDRANQTPRNTYVENHNSLVTVGPASLSNLPFSYDHQQVVAEVGYRILPHTKFTLNDTFDTEYRTYANASFVTTNTITAKVRSQLADTVFGSLSYSYQNRDGHNYINNQSWVFLGDSARDPYGFMTYFDASRRRNQLKGNIDWAPTPTLTTSVILKINNDTYPDGGYGLRNNNNVSIGPDVSWQITPTLNAHAFYTYQQLYYVQNSLYASSTNGGLPLAPTSSQFVIPWTNKTTDSTQTAGVSADWVAIKDVLKFGLDYSFSYGDTAYALGDSIVFFGPNVAGSQITQNTVNFQPLPDATSMLSMLSIHGEYTFTKNVSVIFGWAWEKFTYRDFLNNAGPTQYANLLLPGIGNTNSNVQVFGAGLHIKF